jgi:hypothetical protein
MPGDPIDELQSAPLIRYARMADAEPVNAALLTAYRRMAGHPAVRHTHHFHGRFENTYIDRSDLPEVMPIIEFALQAARHCSGMAELRYGFWFNEMQPGQRTSRHSHAELDELLSAVYYVTAPVTSGSLILHQPPVEIRITPSPGLLVLFPPEIEHEVEPNASGEARLSVAFNFGPLDESH